MEFFRLIKGKTIFGRPRNDEIRVVSKVKTITNYSIRKYESFLVWSRKENARRYTEQTNERNRKCRKYKKETDEKVDRKNRGDKRNW